MGRFKLGSTVINLFAKQAIRFDDSMALGAPTRMGEPYAHQAIYDLELQPTPTLLQVGRLNIPASAGMLSLKLATHLHCH